MKKGYILFEDKLPEVKSQFVVKDGWLKIYERAGKIDSDSSALYCCLVANSIVNTYRESHDWPLYMGSEGKPSVYGDNTYRTNEQDGLEPFLFYKYFSLADTSIEYIDVSEEFILYFKLYEKGTDKQHRTFYYVSDYGELDEVIKVEPNLIKIKLKYLTEYITIREMHFVICFEFMRLFSPTELEEEIEFKDETIPDAGHIYNHLIRGVAGRIQSWILGKVFIQPGSVKKTHYDRDYSKNQDFIIGYDQEGELIYRNCGDRDSHFDITFFKKEVLDKYYNDPAKYKIDGFGISSKHFHLKIDNNISEYVAVFLRDLRILSENEQLHWKQYNIPRKDGMTISATYYRTMIEGNWAEKPETVDLFFKARYNEFNKKWEQKFGWRLFKPLSGRDEYLFTSLHHITSNNIKAFCEQTLTLVKLIIDRLNEKELVRGLTLEPNTKGISKLEKFLAANNMQIPEMMIFLRNLQSLRSGLIAHSFSDSNKDCEGALSYFGLNDGNYIKAAEDIFVKSIFVLNSLWKHFNLDE
jgi:hypothetical protein